MYELIFAQAIGASHLRRNTPCQDYGMVKQTGNYKVFALSDGHGDPNCFRSDRGSKLACETAIDILPNFIDSIVKNGTEDLLYSLDEKLLKQLSTSIIGNWLCRIEDDIESDPITPETISAFENLTPKPTTIKNANEYIQNIRAERAYGCTLIAGIQTDDFVFLLHHGDGRCIVLDENGDAIQPVPWDDRCVGSMTTSCCDKDAISSIRYSVIDLKNDKILACFLSSDGVEDSFPFIDAVYSYFFDNCIYAVENGAEKLSAYLTETLPELSSMGSQDDITVCGIIDVEACVPFIEKFQNFSKKVEAVVTLHKVENNINSILSGGLYTHLKNECSRLQDEYTKVKKEYEELCLMRDKLERNLSSQTAQVNQTEKLEGLEVNNLLSFLQNVYKNCKDSFLETPIKKCVDELTTVLRRIDGLKQEKELLEVKLTEAQKDFDKINDEYQGYLKMKEDLEKQIS